MIRPYVTQPITTLHFVIHLSYYDTILDYYTLHMPHHYYALHALISFFSILVQTIHGVITVT